PLLTIANKMILVSVVLCNITAALVNFSLRNGEVFVHTSRKLTIDKISDNALFFSEIGRNFGCCNAPSNEVEEAMTFHTQFQCSFEANSFASQRLVSSPAGSVETYFVVG